MIIMGAMGYRKQTGFLAGLTVAQISEFSLILAALGYSLGHLQQETVGLITLVGLITISVSTYMILYSHAIYERLAPWLSIFERKVPYRERDGLPFGAATAGCSLWILTQQRFSSMCVTVIRCVTATLKIRSLSPPCRWAAPVGL